MALPGAGPGTTDPQVAEQVEIQAKYQGYIDRQKTEIEHRARQEDLRLPADLDYAQVRGLSIEVQQKLNRAKPETVGQASRVSGVTPAAVSVLLVHLKRSADGTKEKRMSLAADLAAGIAALGISVPADAQQRLLDYLALIGKWNKAYNLTAVREPIKNADASPARFAGHVAACAWPARAGCRHRCRAARYSAGAGAA